MPSKLLLLLGGTEDVSNLFSTAVEEINDGQLSILELVEGLSSHLTSPDEERRRQGVLLLAKVLNNLPINHLSQDEIKVLVGFFCDRLKDRLTVIPAALQGLESLSLMENLSENVPVDIILAMPLSITAQTLTQSSRLSYYSILKNLMLNKTKDLKNNSSDFVYTVISAMDSESDPRCLRFLFQFLPHLLSNFPLNHLVEEAFSVLECYFPIDFNPHGKDDITREDLAQGLQDCLVATPTFGSFIIPTILEKLDSQLKVAHLDSLNLLIRGMGIWPIDILKLHSTEIWKSLNKLILPPSDVEVAELSVKTLVSLICALNESNSAFQELDRLHEDVSASTHGFLSDPNLNLFLPSAKLLAAMSQATERSCEFVVRTVIKQLLALLEQTSGLDITLCALCPILNASVKFNCWNNDTNKISTLLIDVPDKLIEVLKDSKARNNCFACLTEIAYFLTTEQREKIINIILQAIDCEFRTFESEVCFKYLTLIGNKYPEEVKEKLLLKLNIAEGAQEKIKRSIDILCCCCNVAYLTVYSVDKILNHITSTSFPNVGINCLRELCNKTDERVLTVFGTESGVAQKLVSFSLGDSCHLQEDDIIQISKILQDIIRPLTPSNQKLVLDSCLSQFLTTESRNVSCLNSTKLLLLKGLICPLKPDVSIDLRDTLLTDLLDAVLNNKTIGAKESACLILASIINKCENDSPDDKPVSVVLNSLENGKQKETILLLSWITKSLIMRGHPKANHFLDKLILSLNIPTLDIDAANGFKLILQDHDSLSLNNYCKIRLLYKQRIFQKLDDLISLLNNAHQHKNAVLLAIAYTLLYTPKVLIVARLKEIVPLMVQCLDSDSSVVVNAILEVTINLLGSEDQIFEEYIDTFVPRCLQCVHSSHSMVVRMQALDCIYHYGRFTEIHILPHRDRVLNGLGQCLDDKKRLVRRKAVRARNRWFLVGGLPDSSH